MEIVYNMLPCPRNRGQTEPYLFRLPRFRNSENEKAFLSRDSLSVERLAVFEGLTHGDHRGECPADRDLR